MSAPVAVATERDLDNLMFRDWIAAKAGVYAMPGVGQILRLQMRDHVLLQASDAMRTKGVPFGVADVVRRGRRLRGPEHRDMQMPVTLRRVARRYDNPRIVWAAEQQRRRLFPIYCEWLGSAGEDPSSTSSLDIYLVPYMGRATFADFALLATWVPRISPGLMWALFRASPRRATQLFVQWTEKGEIARFAAIKNELSALAEMEEGTPREEDLWFVLRWVERYVALQAEEGELTNG